MFEKMPKREFEIVNKMCSWPLGVSKKKQDWPVATLTSAPH